jgi:RNA polymerase sigma factor (sigma-70 family)
LPDREESEPAWEEDWEQVLRALGHLPKHRRDVLEARFLAGLPSAEVARQMGQTDSWVRVTCMRALRDLRRVLQRGES